MSHKTQRTCKLRPYINIRILKVNVDGSAANAGDTVLERVHWLNPKLMDFSTHVFFILAAYGLLVCCTAGGGTDNVDARARETHKRVYYCSDVNQAELGQGRLRLRVLQNFQLGHHWMPHIGPSLPWSLSRSTGWYRCRTDFEQQRREQTEGGRRC